MLLTPSVLFERAAAPMAVLLMPVVLNRSAAAPNAVFSSAVLEKEGSGSGSGVKVAFGIGPERKPTNRCVRRARGETEERVLPFRRVEARVASVRRWHYRLYYRGDSDEAGL